MADAAQLEKELKALELEAEIVRLEREANGLKTTQSVGPEARQPRPFSKDPFTRTGQGIARMMMDVGTGYGRIGGMLTPGVTGSEVASWWEQNVANRVAPRIPFLSSAAEEMGPGLGVMQGMRAASVPLRLMPKTEKVGSLMRSATNIGPVRFTAGTLGGGAGAEAGEKVGSEYGYPTLGRVIGGVAGGVPAMIPGPSSAYGMLQEATKGLTPEDLFKASQLMRLAEGRGGLQPGQALEFGGTPLTDLQRRTMQSLRGKEDASMVRQAVQQPKIAAENVRALSQSLGPAGDASEVATRTQIAAAEAIREMEKNAGRVAYGPETPRRFTEAELTKTAELLDRYAAMVPERASIAKAVRDDLMSAATVSDRAKAGLPAGFLASAAKTQGVGPVAAQRARDTGGLLYGDVLSMVTRLRQGEPPLSLSKAGVQRLRGGEADDIIDIIKTNLLSKANPNIDVEDAMFRNIQKTVVEPAKEGVLGGLATKAGYGGPPETAPQRLQRFFSVLDDTNRNEKGIRYAASQMNERDPGAFSQLVANWIDQKATKAVVPGQGLREAPKMFSESLLKNPNLDAILESAAIGKVEHPAEFVKGFKDALRVLQAQGRPVATPNISPELADALRKDAAGWFTRYAMNSKAIGAAAMRAQAAQDYFNRRQFLQLSKIFNSPRAMEIIAESSRLPIVSERKATLIYAALAAATDNSE